MDRVILSSIGLMLPRVPKTAGRLCAQRMCTESLSFLAIAELKRLSQVYLFCPLNNQFFEDKTILLSLIMRKFSTCTGNCGV